jgi:hypothetical protein
MARYDMLLAMGEKPAVNHYGCGTGEAIRRWLGLLVLLLAVSVPAGAIGTEGVVVYYKHGCSYYIVETARGYALFDWYDGKEPSEGDVLVGDYESYGIKDIYNRSADSKTRAWVEDFWLSRARVNKKYVHKCH